RCASVLSGALRLHARNATAVHRRSADVHEVLRAAATPAGPDQPTQPKLPAGHRLPVAALDSDADRPRHERGHVMPRGGGGGASAAHQQGTAPAHPGSQWTPVASSSLNVARFSHAGAEIGNSIFVLGGWPDSQFTRAL